jgi:ATP-dependent exoDNAse (exonuclease V) beta subunit
MHAEQSSEIYIVEASAGTGKTYALSKRYIKLLLDDNIHPQTIRNILAITFTNKATREMKERILEFLKKIALDSYKDSNEKEEILQGLHKNKVRQKALDLLDYIIQNYNFFQVKTIDSFVNIILSGCAYSLKLPANFEIAKEYTEHLTYNLDEYIETANHEKSAREIIETFLEQYIFLENKNNWLPKKDIFNLIQFMFSKTMSYGMPFKKFDLKGIVVLKEKKKILSKYNEIRNKLPEGTNKIFLNALNNFLQKNTENFDFDQLSSGMTNESIRVNKGCVIPSEVEKEWSKLQTDLRKLAEKEAYSLLNCYIDIFNPVYKNLREYAHKEDILFLGELNHQAHKLIDQNSITVPELYYRLAARYRHYLIDEFQDTSRLQWQNLYLMVEDAIASGGSLYYVGDKKQAIYRFRAGDVSLFEDIKQKLQQFNPQPTTLNTNYRSDKVIVDFNNKVFSPENLAHLLSTHQPTDESSAKTLDASNINEIREIFKDSQQIPYNSKESGYVNAEAVEYANIEDKEEKIKEKIIALISELKERFQLKEIGILCRDNASVELVSGWLVEANINVESEKTLNIKNNKHIKEIISFLKFLNSPIDNLAFSSFILGDIFTSASQTSREQLEKFILKYRHIEKKIILYREFKKTYPEIWENYIKESFKNVGFIRLYELAIDILRRFNVLDNFSDNHGFFAHFLEIIKKTEDTHNNLTDFIEYLDDVEDENTFVNFSGSDAVKILSIHKAKGLSFNAVIVPFLELDISDIGPGSKGKDVAYTAIPEENDLTMVKLTSKYHRLSDKIAKQYKEEYIKSLIDELNTIYVALTRAKNEMHIFIPYAATGTKNIAQFLIPEGYFKNGTKQLTINEYTEETSAIIPSPKYKTWIGFLKDEFIDIETVKNRNSILRGKILHFMLSMISSLKDHKLTEIMPEIKRKTIAEYPITDNFSEFESIINKVIDNTTTKDFFYIDNEEVFQEKEIVDSSGQTKRIDRLIIKKNEVWIIDYKTKGEIIEDYKKQVLEYINIIQNIYPDKKTRGFLLFLEDIKIEEIL